MKATSFPSDNLGPTGAWATLSRFPVRLEQVRAQQQPRATGASGGLLSRLDRWFWRQTQREREAYLAGARDIYDLEERIRRLERSVAPVHY